MKLMVIGLGQCGSRIADEFARLNLQAERERNTTICTGAFAVNTDQTDLTGLNYISEDYLHRILIGGRKTWGHGVGKVNEVGADLARDDGDKVIDAIKSAPLFYQTHAFLLIAGAAGGTGSGAISVIAQMIKERYIGKPVYAMIVLPFQHEESTEMRSTYNTAVCLKSISSIADGVFLSDNQRYLRKDASMAANLTNINRQIVTPWYDMLCAGEVTEYQHVGAKTLDAGDIIQSINGWSAIGTGTAAIRRTFLPSWLRPRANFRDKSTKTLRAMQAMDAALSDLSISCKPADSGKALFLVSAPAQDMNMGIAKGLGDYLRELASHAVIRSGDYPRAKNSVEVTVLFSQLSFVQKIMDYYERASAFVHSQQDQNKESDERLDEMQDAAKELPSLL